jgi:hypothetical protein
LATFSLTPELIQRIFQNAKPFGHNEKPNNLNLGFGFFYYGLVRAIRPRHIVVIGSGYGFSVICFALALKDNGSGRLSFVDPAFDLLKHGPFRTIGGRGKWRNAEETKAHFSVFGVDDIVTHYRLTSESFFSRYGNFDLPGIDLAFIDGNHSYKNVQHDLQETLKHSKKNTYLYLHDSHIYIREAIRHSGVSRCLKFLQSKKECFELVDFPFSSGVALVRVLRNSAWKCMAKSA